MILLTTTQAQAALVAIFAIGMGIIAYPFEAARKGWVMGGWATNTGGWINLSGILGVFGTLAVSVWQIGWVSMIIALIVGFLSAFVLVHVLRSQFQWLAMLMPLLAIVGLALIRVK